MKIVFSKSDLLNGVNIVQKAVPSKTTMNILECILIDASSDIIKFTANDMELGIETRVKGNILEKGIVAIDAKLFSDVVRKLPDNEVTIETDDSNPLKTVGVIAGVGAAVGVAAYGAHKVMERNNTDDGYYQYEDKKETKDKENETETESLNDQYKEYYNEDDDDLSSFGGEE